MAAGVALPQPLADEILSQYADVLRVGHLDLNGRTIRWDTSASNTKQLQSFCQEFLEGLRRLEPLSSWDANALCRAVHWFCKVVSINYVLAEVLHLLRQKFGAQCAIRTTGSKGESLVGYRCEVRKDCTMRVSVNFSGKGNIICCDPVTAKKQVKGTLSCLEAEFPLPPDIGYIPTYHLHMTLRGSRASRVVERVARTCGPMQVGPRQEVSLDTPLRSADLETCATPGGKSALSTMSLGSSTSVGRSVGSEVDEDDDVLFSIPLSFTAHSVKWDRGRVPSSLPRGLIRL